MTNLDNIDNLFFKREDQNITGSAKDRVIPQIIKFIAKNNFKEAVISSTGNAAISAQYFCDKNNIKLITFISPKTDKNKIKLIKNPIISNKPISDAFKYAKKNKAYLIKLSTDPNSNAYGAIGLEILKQIPQVSDIFIACGSGATALNIQKVLPSNIKLFIVQPASHCPLASIYDKNFINEEKSSTNSLGAKYLPLKKEIIQKIKNGIVVQEKNLLEAQKFLEEKNIFTSPEGALALAAYFKNKNKTGKYPVIILTGAKR